MHLKRIICCEFITYYFKNLGNRARNILHNDLIKPFRQTCFVSKRSLNGEEKVNKIARTWLLKGRRLIFVYSQILGEKTLKEFLKQILKNRKDIVFCIAGVSVYDWNSNRITDAEIEKHKNAFKYVYLLRDETVNCSNKCKDRQSYEDWQVFIEKKDMVVWRRPHISGNFEYMVYGNYDDVSGEDFLNVQIDTSYRKEWDNTAIVLDVVESDPKEESNSAIVYWEMRWPKFFSNRDYVFNRRFVVDCDKKIIVIIGKSTDHPSRPDKKDKFRVTDYFSVMVVKPYSELDKPGIEFVLTYFDNPGVNIPSSVNSWVAMRAMPDFLTRLREATKKYKFYCEKNGKSCICTVSHRGRDDIGKTTENERKKGACFKKKKTLDVEPKEIVGGKSREIEKVIETIRENVEHKLDDIKEDFRKVLNKLKDEIEENYNVDRMKNKPKNADRDDDDDNERNQDEESDGKIDEVNKEVYKGKNEEVLISPSSCKKKEEDDGVLQSETLKP